MMTITALRQLSPDRVAIALDNGSEIKSSLGVVTEWRLSVGRELEADGIEALRRDSARSLARDRAIELISRRRMSQKEVRDKLLQKGESEDAADYAVRWLTERGFLDDESYAAAVARHYAAKGYGAGRVRSELQRRGVEREHWDAALEEMPEADEKLERFISSRLKDPEDRDQVRKVSAALLRRGYFWEEVRSALRRHTECIEED